MCRNNIFHIFRSGGLSQVWAKRENAKMRNAKTAMGGEGGGVVEKYPFQIAAIRTKLLFNGLLKFRPIAARNSAFWESFRIN